MAFIGSGSELEARALEFVKDAEKQLEEDAKKAALLKRALAIVKDAEKQLEAAKKLREKLGKEAQVHEEELRKKIDERKPWLTFDQDLMKKLNLMKKGRKSQI